jgi:hypothetical protein
MSAFNEEDWAGLSLGEVALSSVGKDSSWM